MNKRREELEKWKKEYEEIKEDVLVVAKYYQEQKTRRWCNLVRIIFDGELPNRHFLSKMMKKSYSKTILNEWKKEPRYPNRSIVRHRGHLITTKKAFVMKSNVETPNPAIGGKKYLILPFGSTSGFIVEERDIKLARDI